MEHDEQDPIIMWEVLCEGTELDRGLEKLSRLQPRELMDDVSHFLCFLDWSDFCCLENSLVLRHAVWWKGLRHSAGCRH